MELEKLQKIIARVLNVDAREVTPQTTFTEDLGADSLDVFQILTDVEDTFDIELDSGDLENVVSVGDALELIRRKTA